MMIKANELRIGNWVWVSDTVTNLVFREEQEINIHNLMDLTGYKVDPICEYEPIPLTEEWLLKFGFKKILNQIKGSNLKDEYDLSFVRISHYLGAFEFHGCTQIKYVHQLQNIYFALTGEELKTKQ